MTERKIYHVMRNGANGWKGVLENSGRMPIMGENKQDVVSRTIAMAKNNTMSLVIIHKQDGSIQEQRTYPRSNDINPIMG